MGPSDYGDEVSESGDEVSDSGDGSNGKKKGPLDLRERNRLAAQRQRQRDGKKEEETARQYKAIEEENRRLKERKKGLEAERGWLYLHLQEHHSCNCELIQRYLEILEIHNRNTTT